MSLPQSRRKASKLLYQKPALIDRLDLLSLFKDCPIIIVLILAMAYIVLPDHIINMSAGIIQVTDTKD
jgi:hypothetical protein